MPYIHIYIYDTYIASYHLHRDCRCCSCCLCRCSRPPRETRAERARNRVHTVTFAATSAASPQHVPNAASFFPEPAPLAVLARVCRPRRHCDLPGRFAILAKRDAVLPLVRLVVLRVSAFHGASPPLAVSALPASSSNEPNVTTGCSIGNLGILLKVDIFGLENTLFDEIDYANEQQLPAAVDRQYIALFVTCLI